MFEKVNKAYEFLCTKSAKIMDGPDPENIILILKTQSILFNRHKEGKACVRIFPPANSTMFLVSAAYSFWGRRLICFFIIIFLNVFLIEE